MNNGEQFGMWQAKAASFNIYSFVLLSFFTPCAVQMLLYSMHSVSFIPVKTYAIYTTLNVNIMENRR